MPGNATRRMLQRSIMRPRTGTAPAPRIPPTDNANEVVPRCHPVSAMIGLRNTPNVKPRTGPLQTNKPVTAPTTTHQGLVNRNPMAPSPLLCRPRRSPRAGRLWPLAQRHLEPVLGPGAGHHCLVPSLDIGEVGQVDLMTLEVALS